MFHSQDDSDSSTDHMPPLATPMSALGLHMDDNVVRVAVVLCMGVSLLSTPSMSPVWNGGRPPWATWSQLQDEPGSTLVACSGQRTEQGTGISQSPFTPGALGHLVCKWEKVRWGNSVALDVWLTLVWDATCPNTYAPLHLALAAREAGAVAIQAEQRKTEKYAHLSASHHFVPFTIETSGVFRPEALSLLEDIGMWDLAVLFTLCDPCGYDT